MKKCAHPVFVQKLKPSFWHKLYYFYYVAHFKSYSRASQVLQIAQPILSREIQALEQRLNTLLLVRYKRRPIEITSAGQFLLTQVESIFCALQAIEQAFYGKTSD